MKIPTTDLRARERSGDVTTHKWVYRTRTGACSNSREPNVNQGRQGHGQVDPGPLAAWMNADIKNYADIQNSLYADIKILGVYADIQRKRMLKCMRILKTPERILSKQVLRIR